jgi:DNA-binding CsgD family transcriptional regulator
VARLNHSTLDAFSHAMLRIHEPTSEEAFPHQAVVALEMIFPGSTICYNSFQPSGFVAFAHPEAFRPQAIEVFSAHIDEHPSLTYLMETGSARPVCISDFATTAEWRRTALYNEFFRPIGIRVQLGSVQKAGIGSLGFSINRWSKDFSAEERTLLGLAMPHLIQAWHRAVASSRIQAAFGCVSLFEADSRGAIQICTPKAQQLIEAFFGAGALSRGFLPDALRRWLSAYAVDAPAIAPSLPFIAADGDRRLLVRVIAHLPAARYRVAVEEKSVSPKRLQALGLTPREAEVLFWVSEGKTSAEVAIIVSAKARTIDKHLEHIFSKLNVETRTAAAAIALEFLR